MKSSWIDRNLVKFFIVWRPDSLNAPAMDWIDAYLRPHTGTIAFSIVATVLIIFGNDINRSIKKQIKPYHFPVRVAIFVGVCAFGYGYASMVLARLLANGFSGLTDLQFLAALIAIFISLGLIAERKKYI
ncbi:MAG: DUF3392 family protein [Opitutales bacterium]